MFYTGRFHLSCFCSNTCTFISPVSAPTPALPYLLFLLQHQHFRLYCFCYHPCTSIFTDWFCSHTCTSISTVSIPTPAFPFLLFMFPHLLFHFYCVSSHTCTFISAVSAPIPALISPLLLLLLLHFHFPCSGFPRLGKSQGKPKIFKVREKLGNFLKSQGKFLILSKSENSVFRFIDQNFSSRLEMHFLWQRLNVCCKASKAINLTLYDSM